MPLERLDRVVPEPPHKPEMAGDDHPMRKVTREVAFYDGGWTPERAGKVAALFNELAPVWNERTDSHRLDPLEDALERGGPIPGGVCLEIGCGTCRAADRLCERFSTVVELDISLEMLKQASPARAFRILADAAQLPLPDRSSQCVIMVNALLFPREVDRVLAEEGVVIWVSTLGNCTPIYLPVEDVIAALPGYWGGVASETAWGTWGVLRRES